LRAIRVASGKSCLHGKLETMAKKLNQDQHVKRAAIGIGVTMTGIGAPVALPYAGYHAYKAYGLSQHGTVGDKRGQLVQNSHAKNRGAKNNNHGINPKHNDAFHSTRANSKTAIKAKDRKRT
jgi:hypothetical protein